MILHWPRVIKSVKDEGAIRELLTPPEHPEDAQDSLQIRWVSLSNQTAHFPHAFTVFPSSIRESLWVSRLFTRKLDVLRVYPAIHKLGDQTPPSKQSLGEDRRLQYQILFW